MGDASLSGANRQRAGQGSAGDVPAGMMAVAAEMEIRSWLLLASPRLVRCSCGRES